MPDMGSTEFTMLWASAMLAFVYLLAAAVTSVGQRGMSWALGPRDETPAAINALGGRFDRAWKNFLETFPLFAAAVLLEAQVTPDSDLAALGAQLYFWGRVAFLPLYALGLPVVRTAAWTVSIVGIAIMLLSCLPGI
jgi:uncharacterized MAPEG superfamily protein